MLQHVEITTCRNHEIGVGALGGRFDIGAGIGSETPSHESKPGGVAGCAVARVERASEFEGRGLEKWSKKWQKRRVALWPPSMSHVISRKVSSEKIYRTVERSRSTVMSP